MTLIKRVTKFVMPPYPRVRALKNKLVYPAEVMRDLGWVIFKGPSHIDSLRQLMYSEGGRHMYTKHKVIMSNLLRKYRRTNEIAVYDNIREICGKPLSIDDPRTVIFGVLGPDWPGFSSSTSRVLSGKGLNINFSTSLSLKDETLGFSIFESEIRNEKTLNFLRMIRATIRRDLEIAAIRNDWIMGRQEKEAEKHRLFLRCSYILAENKQKGLLKELQTLFGNRSDAYLLARDAEDLVLQIKINGSILEHVRKNPNEIGIGSKSLFLGDRSITELSMAAKTGSLTMEHVFDVLESSSQRLNIIDSYSFSLPEGISLLQIEFTKNDGSSLTKEERASFDKEFKDLLANRVKIPLGMEIDLRLSETLRGEHEKSQKPQAVIKPIEITDKRYQPFKVIFVAPADVSEKVRQQFLNSKTIMFSSGIPPRKYSQSENPLQLNIFSVNMPSTEKNPYDVITKLIEEITPVRVLERTMRTWDAERFEKTLSALKGKIDESFISNFYLATPPPHRYEIPLEKICEYISMAHELAALKKCAVKMSEDEKYCLLGVSFPTKDETKLTELDKTFKEFNVFSYVTRINSQDDFSIVLYSFKKKDGLNVKKLKDKIEKVVNP